MIEIKKTKYQDTFIDRISVVFFSYLDYWINYVQRNFSIFLFFPQPIKIISPIIELSVFLFISVSTQIRRAIN